MNPSKEQTPSPALLWQRHTQGLQAWIASDFANDGAARLASSSLHTWLGAYPHQASDVSKLALSAAFTAMQAGAYEHADALSSTAVEAWSFAPLKNADDRASAALSAVIQSSSRLQRGNAVDAGYALGYARALVQQMDASSALHVWARSQCELLAGTMAQSLLEWQQASAHFTSARDGVEPLLRNSRLRRELINDWLRVVFGSSQQLTGQSEAAGSLVRALASSHFVFAALGAARAAAALVQASERRQREPEGVRAQRKHAANAADVAASACAEFGIPREVTAVDLRASLALLPDETGPATIALLLSKAAGGDDRKDKAVTAALLGLRSRFASNPDRGADLVRAGQLAMLAADSYAWSAVVSDMIEPARLSEGDVAASRFEMLWTVYGPGEETLRRSPNYLPYRAAFESTIALATRDALHRYIAAPTAESRAYLSSCLEATRGASTPQKSVTSSNHVALARAVATDWLGRIVHAVKARPEAVVLIPVTVPDETVLICVTDDREGMELHSAGSDFGEAMHLMAEEMREHFARTGRKTELAALGMKAWSLLPGRVQALIGSREIVLVVPDAASERLAIPYELLHGPVGFLGLSHVVARLPSLRAVAAALEPEVQAEAHSRPRALCIAAPNTIPTQRLKFAAKEVEDVRSTLSGASWDAPSLEEQAIGPDLLLHGLELGEVVHVAAHGEAFGGSHAILLPGGERLTTEEVTAYHGELPACVYLSVCSIGASEYLGGGVSRGMASSLLMKGARAVVASQWPLQDAAAAALASTFYARALTGSIGEALRAARVEAATKVSPALWGSLILLGNPWHRPGSAPDTTADAAVKLLSVNADPSKTKKARSAALRSARTALKREPSHLRLDAACRWAREMEVLFGGDASKLSGAWAEAMAELAKHLGTLAGEMLLRTAAFDLFLGEGSADKAHRALDRAIDLAERLASGTSSMTQQVHALLARRQQLDSPGEVPEVRLPSGMVVNDRSDPVVRAFFQVQHAVDQREVRTIGKLRLRLPERSLEDVAWNAVVLGQRNRFSSAFAAAGFAERLAARAVAAGVIETNAEEGARRVLAGLLTFLWSAQRTTHLERDRAIGQAGTLRTALEALSGDAVRADAEARMPVLAARDTLAGNAERSDTDRFARARARLRGEVMGPDANAFGRTVGVFIAEAPNGSLLRAHRAAWGYGLLLEVAFEARMKGNALVAEQLDAAYAELARQAERELAAYLFDGFAAARGMPMDPLSAWRSA